MKFMMRPEETMAQRMAERFYQLVFKREIDFPEVVMGLAIALWGVQLLLPWETFTAAASFGVLRAVWPHTETGWGVMFLAFGLFNIAAYFSGHLYARILASLFVSSAWAFIAGAFGYVNPSGTGVVIYAVVSVTSTWVFLRLLMRLRVRP